MDVRSDIVAANTAFFILKILEGYSDVDNKLKKKEILDLLYNNYDIIIEEKQFYRKIDELENVGFRIEKVKGRYSTYYLKKSSLKYADYLYQAAMIKGNKQFTKRQTELYINEYLEQSDIILDKEEQISNLLRNVNESKSAIDRSENLGIIVKAIKSKKQIEYKVGTLEGGEYSFSVVKTIQPLEIDVNDYKVIIIYKDKNKTIKIPLESMYNIEIIEKF